MEDRLDLLWKEYREAVQVPEPGPDFMPGLWRKIEARRESAMSSVFMLRWVEACVVATLAFVLLVSAVLIPRYQRRPVYQSSYVEVLADSADSSAALPVGESE
jgi:hypothetical protein